MHPNQIDGLVMLSGGLDSVMTAHLLKSMGLNVVALHFVLPFYSGVGIDHTQIRTFARQLDIPLDLREEGEEFMEMVRSPEFGFGKNANPCLDCRIHRLVKAKKIMAEYGAAFIATGEVVGQRPMSQRLECLYTVERRSGLEGRLLRPLSARLLPETIPEKEGLVDRSKLLAIAGRGRKPQLEYARIHGLKHTTPAGGCLLTNVDSSARYLTLAEKFPKFTYEDFQLIAYGRHFLLGKKCRLIVSRDESETDILEKIVSADDVQLTPADITGPLGVLRGEITRELITTAATYIARYSRARGDEEVRISVFRKSGESTVQTVMPADPAECDACRF